MYYYYIARTLPPFHSPLLLFFITDQNIHVPKLTYGDLKTKSALGKGPTLRKSNCNAEYPNP